MGARVSIWKPTLDCDDIDVATAFWSWLLGVNVILDGGTARYLGPEEGPPIMSLQQVSESRVGKNRMHLDLITDDLEQVVAEVQQHGGSRLAGPNEIPVGRWYVMADPEGNEFCMVQLATQD
jgi:predicted enzyme related to lactoylglutathione lyase